MLFYRAAVPLSRQTLSYVAGIIRRQALLVLTHLRKGETLAALAAGFGVGTATAWRYVTETVRLLAARAPRLGPALRAAWKAGRASDLGSYASRPPLPRHHHGAKEPARCLRHTAIPAAKSTTTMTIISSILMPIPPARNCWPGSDGRGKTSPADVRAALSGVLSGRLGGGSPRRADAARREISAESQNPRFRRSSQFLPAYSGNK
jgi:Helix-turn-helix of DDE superfamily endonuclease